MKGDKDKPIRVNKFYIYILVIYNFLNGPNGLARPEPD